MSTTTGFDPPAPGYDDLFALVYAFCDLLGVTEDEMRAGSNKILLACDHYGISKFYEHLLLCSPNDLMTLEVPAYGGNSSLGFPAVDAHRISLLSGRRLCALLAYFHYCCNLEGKLIDIMDLKPLGFKVFQMSMFSAA